MAFVDEHRERFGVESICGALQIAPSGYCGPPQKTEKIVR